MHLFVWYFNLSLKIDIVQSYIFLIFNRTILKESGFARYLHSAVLISGAMLIFGGNTHNDTSLSNGAKCFSSDFLAYDIGRFYM